MQALVMQGWWATMRLSFRIVAKSIGGLGIDSERHGIGFVWKGFVHAKPCAHPSPVTQRGDMALTDANPAFGPTEQGIMLEMSELGRFGASWIDSETFENF